MSEHVVGSGAAVPDVAVADVAVADVAVPDIAVPDVAVPDVAVTDAALTDGRDPGADAPGAGGREPDAFAPDSRHHPPMPTVRVERRQVGEEESRRANGPDWDRYADEYQATHGAFLGDAGFVWGPEGLTEAEAGLLGPVESLAGRDVLEVGSGAGQCSRWIRANGGRAIGLDLSFRQLQHSRRLDHQTGVVVPSVLGTATDLPFADASFDVVFSSFGALQFVSEIARTLTETARVLRPGGRFAFSITHPTRWMFPDDPSEAGLVASQSYWDRAPYVEVDDETGEVSYVEHHRTLGDWVALLAGAGFHLTTLLEPEWPDGHDRLWGGWSAARGKYTPGTAIFGADLAG